MKKYKFIQTKLGRYPKTLKEITYVVNRAYEKGFSFYNKLKESKIEKLAIELSEEMNNKTDSYDIDEFAISHDDLILFLKGEEVDRMNLYQLIAWALDNDQRWNCHWIDLQEI